MLLCFMYALVVVEGPDVEVGFISGQDFYQPVSVKVDANDRIYVVDLRDNHVLVFDAEGQPLKTIGGPGQGPGEFRHPGDIAFLPDGRFVVSDSGQRRLHLYDAEGRFLKLVKIVEQPVGSLLVLADGNLLISRSNGVSFNMDMGEEEQKRFGVFDLEGKLLRSFGAMILDKNPLLQVMHNIGPIDRHEDTVIMAGTVAPVLTIYEGDQETNVRYPLQFEPREPTATMKEVEEADGSKSIRMSVETDKVCQGMVVLDDKEILLLRSVTNEDDEPIAKLVKINWQGELLKTWPATFRAQGMTVSRDRTFAYIINETEEEPVISRVTLR